MIEDHVDPAVLRSFAARELSGEDLFVVGWHLFLCDRCRGALATLGPEAEAVYDEIFGGRRMGYPEEVYGEVTQAVAEKLRHRGVEIERDRGRAEALWSELRKHPPSRRVFMVENASRFHNYGLVEVLLDACRRGWSEDPGRAEEMADLALTVTYRLDARLHGPALLNDLKAEAWVLIANCRRIRSETWSVAEAFEIAEGFRAGGTGDVLAEAELLDVRSSFLRDQRRFDEAARVLDRVVEIYRESDDRHAEGRVLINQANLLWERGDEEAAVAVLERATGLVDAEEDPRLSFILRHNLARFRGLAGRADEAAAMIPELRKLALQHGGRLDRYRFLWTEGLVFARVGRSYLAETALRRALSGFVESGIGYDAALVALDLASLLIEEGRHGEARELTSELMPVFSARDVHREAIAALALLQHAVERESATLSLIREVAEYLRLARRNPSLRFEPRG